jgi:hydroxyacylglutathione hydrolase
MIIEKYTCGPVETNTYLIASPEEKIAAVIDPSLGSAKLVASYCKKEDLTLAHIFLTHSHQDHIADVAALKKLFPDVEIWVHALDAPNLETPGKDRLPSFIPVKGIVPDHLLEEGDEVKVGSIVFSVIHTPGHSPGGVCFYSKKEKILFSGDTLFKGTIGNIHFPTSDPEEMWKSLKKLSQLPADTRVFPGHGPDTVLSSESWLSKAKQIYS